MKEILLDNVLPCVFEGQSDAGGDVWRQNVTLERGKSYLVEAGSGTGKSSLCAYLMGFRHDYLGNICYDGQDICRLGVADWIRLRQQHLSLLFQELRLFPELTAIENVELKNRLTGFKTRVQIMQWFEALGIADKVDTPIAHMSFGQQQRVALIRALVQPMDFLLADEPISHLDEENARIMGEIMMEEVHRQGAAVVITSIGKHIVLPYDKKLRMKSE